MSTQTVTPQDIADKIRALDAALDASKSDLSRYGFAALEGDETAIEKVASANAEIERLQAERRVLVAAHALAKEKYADALAERRAAERKASWEAARAVRARLLKNAASFEAAIDNLSKLQKVLEEDTKTIRSHMREANVTFAGIVGRDGVFNLTEADIDNRYSKFRGGHKTFSALVRAWNFLDDEVRDHV